MTLSLSILLQIVRPDSFYLYGSTRTLPKSATHCQCTEYKLEELNKNVYNLSPPMANTCQENKPMYVVLSKELHDKTHHAEMYIIKSVPLLTRSYPSSSMKLRLD